MNKMLEWNDAWLLGIGELDLEHREMVRLLNRLVETNAPEGLIERLDALVFLLRRHFKKEEEFLRAINYPNFDNHKKEHVMEMAEFIQLRRDLESTGGDSLDAATVQSIKHWFFNHVVAEDKRFADFYFQSQLQDVAV